MICSVNCRRNSSLCPSILDIWRNLWEDSRDLAEHALMYTKAQLKAAQEAQKQVERSRLP
jgi:D-psicose/D-tagatose/L-ribulose 3-epimerase